jgi:hypothetical protein
VVIKGMDSILIKVLSLTHPKIFFLMLVKENYPSITSGSVSSL